MILLISLFLWIYLSKNVLRWAQENWLRNASQYWEHINECVKFSIEWVWDVIRLNEQCYWLFYLSKYAWKKCLLLRAQDYWLLSPNQYWEQINEYMTFIGWNGDVIDIMNDSVD